MILVVINCDKKASKEERRQRRRERRLLMRQERQQEKQQAQQRQSTTSAMVEQATTKNSVAFRDRIVYALNNFEPDKTSTIKTTSSTTTTTRPVPPATIGNGTLMVTEITMSQKSTVSYLQQIRNALAREVI